MAVVLSREQRDILHFAARRVFASVGMIGDHYQQGEVAQAKMLRQQCEDVFRLLDDIGWEEEPYSRQTCPLTMPLDQLERTLRHLREESELALGQTSSYGIAWSRRKLSGDAKEEGLRVAHEIANWHLDVCSTCELLLRDLAAR